MFLFCSYKLCLSISFCLLKQTLKKNSIQFFNILLLHPGEKNKLLFSYDWDQISCSVEEGSYTDVKIVKQFDEKPLPIIKVGDKFITELNRSCDVMGTYICVARLKDGTTRNRTIDVEYDNCKLIFITWVFKTKGKKSLIN